MYYELYADTLFLLHFFLNLCMLTFTNYLLSSVARKERILQGAILGAGCVVGVVLIPVFVPVRLLGGLVLSIIIMGKFTFGVSGGCEWKEVLEKLSLSTLLLGSMIIIILRIIPVGNDVGIIRIIAAGTFSYLLLLLMIAKKKRGIIYRIIYTKDKEEQKIEALMDTGNTLVEPISRQPVIVVEQEVLENLFQGMVPQWYRAIPFHSVGKNHGLLKGYRLDSMLLEINGIRKEINNIYVAVASDGIGKNTGYKVILNPQIMERKRRNKDACVENGISERDSSETGSTEKTT